MLRIGLTGGIGSGKSTVADLFAGRGVPVIDADVIARELVEPGQAALAEIVAAFGDRIVDAHGHLKRRDLRERVFADPVERKRLEAILHPRIHAEMARRTAAQSAAYVVLVIPLLFEADQRELVDRVLVVDVSPEVQRRRAGERDGLTAEQLDAMLAAQWDRRQRLDQADDIIDNNGDLAALQRRVDVLHQRYCDLAAAM